MFDEQVMDWIVEALHESHADEKRSPHWNNLRNFFLMPTTEMLSFLATIDISPNANRITADYV
jgi:hypothetical protein